MSDQALKQKEERKGFWGRWIEKLDAKIKKASEKKTCCGGSHEKKGSSCC